MTIAPSEQKHSARVRISAPAKTPKKTADPNLARRARPQGIQPPSDPYTDVYTKINLLFSETAWHGRIVHTERKECPIWLPGMQDGCRKPATHQIAFHKTGMALTCDQHADTIQQSMIQRGVMITVTRKSR